MRVADADQAIGTDSAIPRAHRQSFSHSLFADGQVPARTMRIIECALRPAWGVLVNALSVLREGRASGNGVRRCLPHQVWLPDERCFCRERPVAWTRYGRARREVAGIACGSACPLLARLYLGPGDRSAQRSHWPGWRRVPITAARWTPPPLTERRGSDQSRGQPGHARECISGAPAIL